LCAIKSFRVFGSAGRTCACIGTFEQYSARSRGALVRHQVFQAVFGSFTGHNSCAIRPQSFGSFWGALVPPSRSAFPEQVKMGECYRADGVTYTLCASYFRYLVILELWSLWDFFYIRNDTIVGFWDICIRKVFGDLWDILYQKKKSNLY
jgi:hypothetical protein